MPLSQQSRTGAIVLLAGSLAGLVAALYAYVAPLTGVTGTLGALLVIVTSAVLAVLALALAAVTRRAARNGLRAVIVIGLAGTIFAGALLHAWWLCLAMIVGIAGLAIDIVHPARANAPASS